jgi:predicted nucleotidyltransferase
LPTRTICPTTVKNVINRIFVPNKKGLMIENSKIIEIVNKIVLNLNPEKIFLFESCASGNPNSASDLDLIIIQVSKLPNYNRVSEIRRLIIGSMIHIDFIICTPFEYEEGIKSSFLYNAIKTSKLLYKHI